MGYDSAMTAATLIRTTLALVIFISLEALAQPIERKVERIDLTLSNGTIHNALISTPATVANQLPLIILMGGFNTGEKALKLLREDINAIFATTDYPYKSPHNRSFVKDLGQIPQIKRAVGNADLAIDALIETLKKDRRVDADKMIFVGASFGAPFTITAGVRNPALDALVLIHAFGRVPSAITRQLTNSWGEWSYPIAWALGKIAWIYLDYEAPESEVLKLHPHQEVLYIYSDADEQLPLDSIETLQSALKNSPATVTLTKNRGGHLGPGKTEMISELMDISLAWLRENNLL